MQEASQGTQKQLLRYAIFFICILACLFGFVSPAIGLLLGLLVANTSGHPFKKYNQKLTQKTLQVAVVGLGFGIHLQDALQAGKDGFVFALATIIFVLVLSTLLAKLIGVEKITAYLLGCGTAICGGSAIAAVAPVVKASEKQISVSLGVVFILNAIALFAFPTIAHYLNLSQKQFGMWCAISIHDTSSVVGAASRFGTQTLQIATTIKLSRALYIIPLTLFSAFIFRNEKSKVKIPWFIALFVLAVCSTYYFPALNSIAPYIVAISKALLTATLFFIGAGIDRKVLLEVGPRPFLLSTLIWIVLAICSLLVIMRCY